MHVSSQSHLILIFDIHSACFIYFLAINTDAFRSKPHFTSDNENSQDQRANDVISSLFHPEGNTRSTKLSDEREISRVEMTDDDREALLEIFRRVVLNLCLDREFDNPELCHKRSKLCSI